MMNNSAVTAAAFAAGLLIQTHTFAAAVASIEPGNSAASQTESAARDNWRSIMRKSDVPSDGCFHASYPNMVWESVECKVVEPRYLPASALPQGHMTDVVGAGNDYVLNSHGLINLAVGNFSTSGITSEIGVGVPANNNQGVLGANDYTLQINTNSLQYTAACNGHSGCTVWQQFIYSSDLTGAGEGAVYMEYWLLGYGPCQSGSGYSQSGQNCVKKSAAVAAPKLPITDLTGMGLAARVTPGGNDVLTFTGNSEAYAVTAKDSVLDIAMVWDQVEFNVLGDHGGSQAQFNAGSSITVNLFAGDGTSTAPECYANNGTATETNNLTLGTCSSGVFLEPYIEFTEYLIKRPVYTPPLPPIASVD